MKTFKFNQLARDIQRFVISNVRTYLQSEGYAPTENMIKQEANSALYSENGIFLRYLANEESCA